MILPVIGLAEETVLTDDFNDNNLDSTIWIEDVTGSQSSYQELNQEATFTIYGEHAYLVSKPIEIVNWDQITISGTWKSPSVTTAEMNCYLIDNETNERIGVAYDNWYDLIRYWHANENNVEISRTSPQTYTSFQILLNHTHLQYWENDELIHENKSTALSETTQFQLKIGGWDTSSMPDQIIYFDDITLSAAPNVSKKANNGKQSTSFLESNQTFIDNQIGSRSILGSTLGKEYAIPIATTLSILLLFLLNILVEFISDYSSEKIIEYQKKKKTTPSKTMKTPQRFLNKQEIKAVIITTLILSFVISWTWAPTLAMFLEVFLITLIIVALLIFFKETLRSYLCHQKQLHSEYYVWPLGGIMMLVSTFLGNTFSLTANHQYDEQGNIKQCGQITFTVSLIMYIIVLVAFITNLFYHSVILQMIIIATILNLFIDLFPLNPMDGYEIRHYNFSYWGILYLCVLITYITVYFNLIT